MDPAVRGSMYIQVQVSYATLNGRKMTSTNLSRQNIRKMSCLLCCAFCTFIAFFKGEKEKLKSTDCFSKAKSSTFQYLFHAFPYFSILFQALYKNKNKIVPYFCMQY